MLTLDEIAEAARRMTLRRLLEFAVREWAPKSWEGLTFMEEAQRAIDMTVFGRDLKPALDRVREALDDEAFERADSLLKSLPQTEGRVVELEAMLAVLVID